MIRLTRREKLLAITLAIFAAGCLMFAFAIKPALARTKILRRVISEKQNDLEKLRATSKEYIILRDSLENIREKVASQDKGFELLPFLESLIRKQGLVKKAAAMKQHVLNPGPGYSETIVEIKLESLTLKQLVDFLSKVESSQVLVRIKSLYIKKNPTNTEMLDSVIEIHNPKLIQS